VTPAAPRWLVDAGAVGLGGAVGTLLRYWLSGAVYAMAPAPRLPWGTLVVNVAGCFAIGLLGGLAETRGVLTASARLFLLIGVLGGFTTFSTFGYETLALLREQALARAFLNVGLQLTLGLGAAWAGLATSRLW
jgi:fluoride exporter